MLVMKFGGTSLADAPRIRRVVQIIRSRAAEQPVVVVSAHAGVTDSLLRIADLALTDPGRSGSAPSATLHEELLQLRRCHDRIAGDLGIEVPEHWALFDALDELLRGAHAGQPRALRDEVASFGERLSCYSLSAALNSQGIRAVPLMAYDLGLRSDSDFGSARVDEESFSAVATSLRRHRGIRVVTGYIAKDAHGEITTLGRNGSDITAACMARAARCERLDIWTDVPGVMTCDPKWVPEARTLEALSYEDATRLASLGASVLHPECLRIAQPAAIRVRVLDSVQPHQEGTSVHADVKHCPDEVLAILVREPAVGVRVPVEPTRDQGFLSDFRRGIESTAGQIFCQHVESGELFAAVSDLPGSLAQSLRNGRPTWIQGNLVVLTIVGQFSAPAAADRVRHFFRSAGAKPFLLAAAVQGTHLYVVISHREALNLIGALHAELLGISRKAAMHSA